MLGASARWQQKGADRHYIGSVCPFHAKPSAQSNLATW